MLSEQDMAAVRGYITNGLAHGQSTEALKEALVTEGGWSAIDVDIAFAHLSLPNAPYGFNANSNSNIPSGYHANTGAPEPAHHGVDTAWNIVHPKPLDPGPIISGHGSSNTHNAEPLPSFTQQLQTFDNTVSNGDPGRSKFGILRLTFALLGTCVALIFGGYLIYHHLSTTQSDLPREVELAEPTSYTLEEQHALVMPAVVRVFKHIKGSIEVSPFSINVEKLEVVPIKSLQSISENIDQRISGTAFSISEDGLFATNAHVAAAEDVLRLGMTAILIEKLLVAQYVETVLRYGEKSREAVRYLERMKEISEMDEDDPQLKKLALAVLEKITYRDSDSEVRLVPQGTKVRSSKDIEGAGFKVKEVLVHDDWLDTGKDVALLAVQGGTSVLPALALNTTSNSIINQHVAAYGFPGATDTSINSFANITVTQGTVTGLKTINDSLEVLQSDAKVSKGSSGGPLVDGEGRVVGIITLESGSEKGDNFAFALPGILIEELASLNDRSAFTTEYQTHIRSGLALKEHRRCARAVDSFDQARNILGGSLVTHDELDTMVAACEEMVRTGTSLDTKWDMLKDQMRSVSPVAWFLIVSGAVLGLVVLIAFFVLLRKLRQDRMRIQTLEHEVEQV